MWLIVGQIPMNVGWRVAYQALWDFSRSNKHCIHLSSKTIYFSRFVLAMSAFAPIKISYSNTVCNKSAAEAWIYLVSFYGGEWWSKGLHCHMYFPQNNHFLSLKYQCDIVFSIFFSLDQNVMKPEKRPYI